MQRIKCTKRQAAMLCLAAVVLAPSLVVACAQFLVALAVGRLEALAVARSCNLPEAGVLALAFVYNYFACYKLLSVLRDPAECPRFIKPFAVMSQRLAGWLWLPLKPLLLGFALLPQVGLWMSIFGCASWRGKIYQRALICAAANTAAFKVWIGSLNAHVSQTSRVADIGVFAAWAVIAGVVCLMAYRRRGELIQRLSYPSFVPQRVRVW